MKAKVYDRVTTVVDIPFGNNLITKGTIGTVIECYQNPKEIYAVDLTILSETGEPGFDYESVILHPDQFTVVSDTPEMGDFISVFGDISYQVPQVVSEQASHVEVSISAESDQFQSNFTKP